MKISGDVTAISLDDHAPDAVEVTVELIDNQLDDEDASRIADLYAE